MILRPSWSVPAGVQSAYTTRQGGRSVGPYESFNLATHVGDELLLVEQNRAILKNKLNLPQEPEWLTQVHGADILNLDQDLPEYSKTSKSYDASFTTQAGKVCVIMTGDCLPLLLCDEKGVAIAAVHCGWRSIAAGLIQKVVFLFKQHTDANIIAWLGPAIGPKVFEIGGDVRTQLMESNKIDKNCFIDFIPDCTPGFIPLSNDNKENRSDLSLDAAALPWHVGEKGGEWLQESSPEKRYLANIYQIATSILLDQGLMSHHIYQQSDCTYSNKHDFYSHRRDKITGRMASLIWIS